MRRKDVSYNPIVGANDMTVSWNIAFVKRSLNVAPRSSIPDTYCTPLVTRNNRSKLDSLHHQPTRSYTNLSRDVLSHRW